MCRIVAETITRSHNGLRDQQLSHTHFCTERLLSSNGSIVDCGYFLCLRPFCNSPHIKGSFRGCICTVLLHGLVVWRLSSVDKKIVNCMCWSKINSVIHNVSNEQASTFVICDHKMRMSICMDKMSKLGFFLAHEILFWKNIFWNSLVLAKEALCIWLDHKNAGAKGIKNKNNFFRVASQVSHGGIFCGQPKLAV